MASKKADWIKKAVSKHPGRLTAKAKAAGKSIGAFCSKGGKDTETKRECNLRSTLMKFKKAKGDGKGGCGKKK